MLNMISMLRDFFYSPTPPLVYQLLPNGQINKIAALPDTDKFYMTLNLNDQCKITYDPSNYTLKMYNENATRLCGNNIQVFGVAYVEAMTQDGEYLKRLIESVPIKKFIC